MLLEALKHVALTDFNGIAHDKTMCVYKTRLNISLANVKMAGIFVRCTLVNYSMLDF